MVTRKDCIEHGLNRRTPNIKYGVYPASEADNTISELVTRTVSDNYGDPPTLLTGVEELVPISQGFTDTISNPNGRFLTSKHSCPRTGLRNQ